jgi:archaellum biogenesis ATPase FlaH
MSNISTNKQKLLIEYLISSPDTYAVCSSVVKPEYFAPELKGAVEFINDYYEKYNSVPDESQVLAETDIVVHKHNDITRDKIDYCASEIEGFCKKQAFKRAILAAPKLMEEDREAELENMVKDALMISLQRNLGLSYFENPIERLKALSNSKRTIPTKWKDVDRLLGGGISRKEMILFSANSGGGKSITMANLGLNLAEQGMNVLYISLELDEELISKRFDSMVTGMHQAEIVPRMKEVAQKVEIAGEKMGKIDIIQMTTGTNATAIRAFLKEYELIKGFVPDAIIVDYLDLMSPNEKISADNVFQKDKLIAEQLRDIGVDYDMFVITASQQNRGAIDAEELHQGHIAGGISKVNTTDVYISIIMTNSMRSRGEMAFQFLKTRNSDGVGHVVQLNWDSKALRVTDSLIDDNGDRQPFEIKKDPAEDVNKAIDAFNKPSKLDPPKGGGGFSSSILDLIDT